MESTCCPLKLGFQSREAAADFPELSGAEGSGENQRLPLPIASRPAAEAVPAPAAGQEQQQRRLLGEENTSQPSKHFSGLGGSFTAIEPNLIRAKRPLRP